MNFKINYWKKMVKKPAKGVDKYGVKGHSQALKDHRFSYQKNCKLQRSSINRIFNYWWRILAFQYASMMQLWWRPVDDQQTQKQNVGLQTKQLMYHLGEDDEGSQDECTH